MIRRVFAAPTFMTLITLALGACGGSDSPRVPQYTVGGTVSGLAAGQTLVLLDNGADPLSISANGPFVFKTALDENHGYAISVGTAPAGQHCSVTGGAGTASANVASAAVRCTDELYTVGGTVTGLEPNSQVTVQNNGADTLTLAANQAFTFPTALAYNSVYSVAITAQPAKRSELCRVENGFSIVTQTVTTIRIACGATPQYAYVVAQGFPGSVVPYQVTRSGLGALTVPAAATGNTPQAIAVDPAYRYAYVTNYGDGSVSQYSIGANGALVPLTSVAGTTPLLAATVSTGSGSGSGPTAVAVDPQGMHLYVLNATDSTISQFAIGPGGGLTRITVTDVPTAPQPAQGAPSPIGQIAINPASTLLLVTSPTDTSGTVSQYAIAADGSLSPLATPSVMAGLLPTGIAIAASGATAYVANSGDSPGDLTQFSLSASGLDGANTVSVAAGAQPASLALDPTGRYLYEADYAQGGVGTVSGYTVDAMGALTPMPTPSIAAGTSALAVAVDLGGQFVFATNPADLSLSQYQIGPNGALSALPTVTLGATPVSIALAYGH